MKIEQKSLPRGQVEITIELTAQEYEPFLKEAAFHLSETLKIAGFRLGKAPYEIVKAQVGEAKIWEEAIEPAVKKTLYKAVDQNKLATIGSPKIDIVKLAPGNPVAYKATLNILPWIKLAEFKNLKIKRQPIAVTPEKLASALKDLQKLRGKEALINRAAAMNDKVEIDFTAYLDKVPLESGQQKKFSLVIGENMFIPEFEKNLIGLKAGDKKEFNVKFPDNYHQKNLAGKPVDFKVTVNAVYEIQLPELNNEFAKNLGGFADLDELKKQLNQNLIDEAKHKEEHRLEEEAIEKLVTASQFGEVPDILITSEVQKILQELERNISSQGLNFEDYLRHLNKKRADLLLDFTPTAVKRIKGALVTREVARQQKIEVTKQELNEEIEKVVLANSGNEQIKNNLKQPEYRHYVENVISSRKVMDYLVKQLGE